MSEKQRITNTFQGGMVEDIDPHLQTAVTYRRSENGRVIFNTNSANPDLAEGATQGRTFAWVVDIGNKLLLTACPGFRCLGGVDLEDEIISLWTDEVNSQIRSCKIDDRGIVFDNWILFDDRNDPNGDKMHLTSAHFIKGRAEVENENTRRIYFWDNRNANQPRVVNIELLYRSYVDGAEIKKKPVHWVWDLSDPENPQPVSEPACDEQVTYPHWLSVHSFDWNTDAVFPLIKFYRRLLDNQIEHENYSTDPLDFRINKRCALKTGAYQYFVRYVTRDGYKTPISIITQHLFLTSKFKDAVNHHNYNMYASNVVTPFGIELIIKDIDTRYYQMEIGYIFSIDDKQPHEYTIFSTMAINPLITTMNVQHVNHTGIPISADEVLRKYESVMGVNDGDVEESKMYLGAVNVIPEVPFELSKATIKPFMRLMNGDETIEPLFEESLDEPGKPEPATNTSIVTKQYSKNMFTGHAEDYEVYKDYDNYKGMQFEHLFTGYWKGDIYGVGVVGLDRKGNPVFTQHIQDFKFPEMYEPGYDNIEGVDSDTAFNHTWFDPEDGTYKLKLMGMLISGIRIPRAKLFDKYGKMNIVAFAIVRNPRNKRIQHQGIILNCTHEINCKADKDDDDEPEITRPLPFLSNFFSSAFYQEHNTNLYGMWGRCARRDKKCKISYLPIVNRPHTFTYECPDLFVTGETLQHKDTDYIKLVGTCHKAYANENIHYGHDGYYTKSYKTNNQENRYPLGSESRLQDVYKFAAREQRKPYDSENTELQFTNDIWGLFIDNLFLLSGTVHPFLHKTCGGGETPGTECFPTTGITGDYYVDIEAGELWQWDGIDYIAADINIVSGWRPAMFASGHKNTTALKCKDFMHLDIIENLFSKSSYHFVNFLKPNDAYYADTTEPSLEVRRYISTGHYQRLDAEILNQAKKVMKDGSIVAGATAVVEDDIEFYQFDDIEVWGGDAFLQFVDFTRLNPYYVGACQDCGGVLLDYAASHIIPLECNHNLMMRYGRTFAKNGTQAQAVSCNNEDLHMRDGIMDKQPEDWNVNAVLQHQNNVQYFASKPYNIKITEELPTRIYYSLVKTYNELEDSYRKILRLNYNDLPGIHGEIIGMERNFSTIYVWQEKAFGGLRINQRQTVPTELGAELQIGSGKDLDGVEYISTIYGCQHRDSIKRMNNGLYWIDGRMGKQMRFAQDGSNIQSDSRGSHDVFTKALPFFEQLRGAPGVRIHAAADYVHNDVIFTLISPDEEAFPSFTKSYNETVDKYHQYYAFLPHVYLHHKKFFISPDPENEHKLYLHGHGKRGHYYDRYYKSRLVFVVNPSPSATKVYDDSLINVDNVGYRRIGIVKHSTQNQTHTLNLKTDTRVKYREDKLRYPIREKAYKIDRVRGHYMIVDIEIDNGDQAIDGLDLEVAIMSVDTEYRLSHKI